MKIKELQKVVNIAWSPLPQYPIYLAAGTAAQQFDSNANSVLEIYSTNFSDPSYELDLKTSQNTKYKFHKLIWSPTGFGALNPNGLIVGGCEGGHIMVYSAGKLLSQEDGLLACQDKHSGPVSGLDFNPFQMNLLASCASESEIFIWDLNNTSTHMNPGTKTQPLEDVKNVAWNRQVQHILASVFSGRCVIWDLRKSEQIIKLSDTQSRVRWHAIQWHPDMATQVWLASEDDQSPVIQLWDLRYATAPAKTVQIHQRGVLGMSWCSRDSDLMVSCGKDNRIYCWNPNSQQPNSEILSEVATTASWYSDVQWCPRNPALIASSSFDGNVSIYSLFGGTQQQVQTSNKIADSFPGMDNFDQVPINQRTAAVIYQDLKYAPKWLKPKAGVAFGFGGKLVSFNSNNKKVNVHQVITEPLLVERAQTLEKTLNESTNFIEFCREKADQMADQNGRYLWYFIKANFERNPKEEILNLLGYNAEDTDGKFAKYVNELDDSIKKPTSNVEHITNRMSQLGHGNSTDVECDQSSDGSISSFMQPTSDSATLFDDIAAATAAAAAVVQKQQFNDSDTNRKPSSAQFKILRGEDNIGLITEAIITGNIEAAVQLCLNTERIAEALILASTTGIDFLTKIQNHYLQQQQQQNDLSHIISALVSRDWMSFITHCDVESWKEALVAALRHNERKVSDICEKLGDRLLTERSQNIDYTRYAILCFVCAGNLDKLIMAWHQLKQLENNNAKHTLNTEELQELAEIVMLMNKSLEQQGVAVDLNNKAVEFITEYGCLLVAQGAFTAALTYLMEIKTSAVYPELDDLRQRISNILQPQPGRFSMFQGQQQPQQPQLQTLAQPYHTGTYSQSQHQQQLYQASGAFSHSTTIPSGNVYTGSNKGNVYQVPPANSAWNPNAAINTSMVPPSRPSSHSHPMIPNNNNALNSTTNVQQQQQPLPPQSLKQPIIENIPQPSRPQSTTSSHDGVGDGNKAVSGLRARSKYVLDPSVAASNATNVINPYGNIYNPTPTQLNSNTTQYNSPTSFSYNNNNISNNNSSNSYNNVMSTPMATSFNTDPSNIMPNTSLHTSTVATAAPFSYTGTYLLGVAPIETATSSPPPAPFQNMQRNPTPPPGWNDPPCIQSTRQTKKMESSQAFTAPITHPIFGADPNQNQNGYTDVTAAYMNNQRNVSGISHQAPPPPTSSTPPILRPSNNDPMNFQHSQQQQQYNQQYLIQQRQPQQQEPHYTDVNNQYQQQKQQQQIIAQKSDETQVTTAKPPLPEQYIYLQTVLEELKSHCLNKTTDQRTKRKFVDVAKRLETLYDCLRDGRLTPATIQSLNQIVQYIQVGDYGNALQCHTQIAFGADFSQCAGFMPGLKVLIQSANELHVYL